MSSHAAKRAFGLLGIAPTTDQKEIRRAWRALVRTYHPDLAKEDPEAANRRLAEINEAFDVVMAVASDTARAAPRGPQQDADVARRMAEARRAEARRQSEARQAEAERQAHAAQRARAQAARQAREAAEAKRAMDAELRAKRAARAAAQEEREKTAAARRAAGAVGPSRRNPTVERAAQAFSSAISIISSRSSSSDHNTTC